MHVICRYDRWLAARSGFGGIGRNMLALSQQAVALTDAAELQAELEK